MHRVDLNGLEGQRVCDACFHNELYRSKENQGSTESDTRMVECPVCSRNISRMSETEGETHVATCLDLRTSSTSDTMDAVFVGTRRVVRVLDETIEDSECTICLESFNAGQRVATLNCLCVFHEDCIKAWFENPTYGKNSCPIHINWAVVK